MRVWLIKLGESVPTDGPNVRIMRVGSLAETLVQRGHEVVWWSASFDHSRKTHRFAADTRRQLSDRYVLRFIRSMGYKRNVSIERIIDHVQIGRRFSQLALQESRPDVIFCAFPTIELAIAAMSYGRSHGVPVVLDVRDLWPDAFAEFAPSRARSVARIGLRPLDWAVSLAFRRATAITAINQAFLEWGLRHARRARGAWDRVFPLAFNERPPPEDAARAALRFWHERGLREGGDEFVACFFGTMGRHVDLAPVVESARLLDGGARRFRFVLCGTGDHFEDYKARAAGCTNVLFPGWLDAAQIWALMQLSTVGLAAYRNTPDFAVSVPNKAIEYLSAGLPVISSLQGVLENLLRTRECGLTFEPTGAALAEVLVALDKEPGRRLAMSNNAVQVFRDHFMAERVYAEMCDYLADIGSRGASPTGVQVLRESRYQ